MKLGTGRPLLWTTNRITRFWEVRVGATVVLRGNVVEKQKLYIINYL